MCVCVMQYAYICSPHKIVADCNAANGKQPNELTQQVPPPPYTTSIVWAGRCQPHSCWCGACRWKIVQDRACCGIITCTRRMGIWRPSKCVFLLSWLMSNQRIQLSHTAICANKARSTNQAGASKHVHVQACDPAVSCTSHNVTTREQQSFNSARPDCTCHTHCRNSKPQLPTHTTPAVSTTNCQLVAGRHMQ
jgi:hypothetical protein